MQTSDPTCDADSGLSLKERGVDIVSIVCQRMPMPGVLQERRALASCF
jgi:hypothetical protein